MEVHIGNNLSLSFSAGSYYLFSMGSRRILQKAKDFPISSAFGPLSPTLLMVVKFSESTDKRSRFVEGFLSGNEFTPFRRILFETLFFHEMEEIWNRKAGVGVEVDLLYFEGILFSNV